ncbi:MAG: nucleoside/nucleotide kinase family protein [Candidatus Scalindua sp.]
MTEKINKLATELLATLSNSPGKNRYFLGITGCPAAGKSMLAKSLADEINFRTGDDLAAVVPMDGFHLPNSILKQRGLLNIKGAPETFDADSFVELINRLHEFPDQSIMCPAYDRKIHDPVKNSITIRPCNRLIIIEGNYLLLNVTPWNMIRTKMNEVWYIDTPLKTVKEQLLRRHIAGGTSKKEAERKVESVDIPNAELIKKTLLLADKIVNLDN